MIERFFKQGKAVIALVLIISLMLGNLVYANTENAKTIEIDGLSYNVTDNGSSYVLTCEKDGYDYEAVLEKLTNKIHITCDKNMLLYEENVFAYDVEIENFDKDNAKLEYVLKDNDTGKKIEVDDSEYLEGQIPIAIGGGIALGELIAALLSATAVCVVAGMSYYVLSDVIADIQEKSRENKKYYYYAMVKGSKLLIGDAFEYEASAIKYAREKLDSRQSGVFSIGYTRADFLASTASPVNLSYSDGKHESGDGYRPHYHPRITNNGTFHYDLHCWY